MTRVQMRIASDHPCASTIAGASSGPKASAWMRVPSRASTSMIRPSSGRERVAWSGSASTRLAPRLTRREFAATPPASSAVAVAALTLLPMSGSHLRSKVIVHLVRVRAAECRAVLFQPSQKRDVSERPVMRREEPGGETANLVGREDYVPHDDAERPPEGCHRAGRCVQDRRSPADGTPNGEYKLLERHRVRTGCVHGHVAETVRGAKADAREVVNVDRLHEV